MRNDVKLARGLGVAAVSVLLVAGAAFAADGLIRTSREGGPAAVSPVGDQVAEPAHGTETPEPTDASDNSTDATVDQATETPEPKETPDAAETPEPKETPDAAETPEPKETPEATDNHSGDSGQGGDSGGGND